MLNKLSSQFQAQQWKQTVDNKLFWKLRLLNLILTILTNDKVDYNSEAWGMSRTESCEYTVGWEGGRWGVVAEVLGSRGLGRRAWFTRLWNGEGDTNKTLRHINNSRIS